jgi:sulfite oxidase
VITPVDQFLTRSHAAYPIIDPSTWRLHVQGLVERPLELSLAELGAVFPTRRVTATLVCAGMRRNEFLSLGPLTGELPWGPEAASTGLWSGVALSDVLRASGVTERARHVEFIGRDEVERHGHRFGFGASIDLDKALGAEVLLATDLNEEPLPVSHGFPMRVVVPGWIGARSVKWLTDIVVSDAASENYFQRKAYRVQREVNSDDPRDVSAGVAMRDVPLNAVIVEPQADRVVPAGTVRVRGWALGSGGRRVIGVELSPNDGQDWLPARSLATGGTWTWMFWEADVVLQPGRHTLVVRATDDSGTVQPATVAEVWNVKGYGNNAWHRVPINVE